MYRNLSSLHMDVYLQTTKAYVIYKKKLLSTSPKNIHKVFFIIKVVWTINKKDITKKFLSLYTNDTHYGKQILQH